nr:phosphatidylinositol 3,4,5-trisphosphate 3-phosphatase and protein-tyrosine-phosphatase PTEN2A-like [Tanacetum cinerariifolium]
MEFADYYDREGKAQSICQWMTDDYSFGFNTRACQLVLGAGAMQKGMDYLRVTIIAPSFCQSAYEWLEEDILNVVVVHCKVGKARTALMICSLLFVKVYLMIKTYVESDLV